MAQSVGGAIFGLLTGYLVAGFLVCLMQTLPLSVDFLGFDPRYSTSEGPLRKFLPPDRVWLGMMCRAGAYAFSSDVDLKALDDTSADKFIQKYKTFDKYATFEHRYARYRRHTSRRNPLPYSGELNRQLYK